MQPIRIPVSGNGNVHHLGRAEGSWEVQSRLVPLSIVSVSGGECCASVSTSVCWVSAMMSGAGEAGATGVDMTKFYSIFYWSILTRVSAAGCCHYHVSPLTWNTLSKTRESSWSVWYKSIILFPLPVFPGGHRGTLTVNSLGCQVCVISLNTHTYAKSTGVLFTHHGVWSSR